jgi:hypothetical protein
VRLLFADRHAIAAKYHEGQISAQLRVHKAPLLQAEIMSTVVMSARREAERREIPALLIPTRTPKTAGRRNRNKQAFRGVADGTIQRQPMGRSDSAALAQSVRREIDPTM